MSLPNDTHQCAGLLANAAHMNTKSGGIYQRTSNDSYKLLLFQTINCPFCAVKRK